MRESTKHSPVDRGEVVMTGTCQVCGAMGRVIAVPGAQPPNEFCPRCAIEYAQAAGGEGEDELPP
jgi:hypothetical protein